MSDGEGSFVGKTPVEPKDEQQAREFVRHLLTEPHFEAFRQCDCVQCRWAWLEILARQAEQQREGSA